MIYAKDISVVIPVLNAACFLPELFRALKNQKPFPPREIVLVDSGSTDNTIEIASKHQNVRIVPIRNFSHGRSRNLGAKNATGEIIVLMTQDALPRDETWLKKLLEPFSDKKVAAVYSRQVPKPDAIFTERFFMMTRFPDSLSLRKKKTTNDGELTLEKVFFSNVSSAIRRSILLQYPFDETLIMSEDQQLSRDLLNAGYTVVYAPDSVVIHSHNYTLASVFKRYFDSVYSLTLIFPGHGVKTSVCMGANYLLKEIVYVLRNYPYKMPYYFIYLTSKIAGTLMGHFAKSLPRCILKKISMHYYHWE